MRWGIILYITCFSVSYLFDCYLNSTRVLYWVILNVFGIIKETEIWKVRLLNFFNTWSSANFEFPFLQQPCSGNMAYDVYIQEIHYCPLKSTPQDHLPAVIQATHIGTRPQGRQRGTQDCLYRWTSEAPLRSSPKGAALNPGNPTLWSSLRPGLTKESWILWRVHISWTWAWWGYCYHKPIVWNSASTGW